MFIIGSSRGKGVFLVVFCYLFIIARDRRALEEKTSNVMGMTFVFHKCRDFDLSAHWIDLKR